MNLQPITSIKNIFSDKIKDKRSLIYFGIVILAGLVCLVLIWHFSQMPEIKKTTPLPAKPSQEEIIQRQLRELEKLKNANSILTEEETQAQLKELESLRSSSKPPSGEEIQKQLEELDKLRSNK